MREQKETPLYATLNYGVRKSLDISIAEYFYVDMVYHLSRNEKGYCYKSIESIAVDMGISKNGVIKLRDRLINKGLIKKNIKGYVKTTEMYHKVVRDGESTYHLVTKAYHKVVPSVPLSSTKNNNRITLERENNKIGSEQYKKAREKARLIREQRGWLKPVDNTN